MRLRCRLCVLLGSRVCRCTHCGLLIAAVIAAVTALVLDVVGPTPGVVLVLMVVMAFGLAVPCGMELLRRALRPT